MQVLQHANTLVIVDGTEYSIQPRSGQTDGISYDGFVIMGPNGQVAEAPHCYMTNDYTGPTDPASLPDMIVEKYGVL